MYAIIRSGGKQYRVRAGDHIVVSRLDAEPGAEVTFGEVLLMGEGDAVQVGAPTLPGAQVTARVEAQQRAPKVTSLKYKNKTRHRRLLGHRQHQTRVLITAITGG